MDILKLKDPIKLLKFFHTGMNLLGYGISMLLSILDALIPTNFVILFQCLLCLLWAVSNNVARHSWQLEPFGCCHLCCHILPHGIRHMLCYCCHHHNCYDCHKPSGLDVLVEHIPQCSITCKSGYGKHWNVLSESYDLKCRYNWLRSLGFRLLVYLLSSAVILCMPSLCQSSPQE